MLSERSLRIPPFYVMEILERAQKLESSGADIVHLEIGEPDFPTPQKVIESCILALSEGRTKYTHSLGIPELREAIAEHYARRYGVDVSPGNIIVTGGTSPAMVLVFSTLLNPGEGVLLSNPCYACYPNIVEFVGGVPEYLEIREEDGFKFRTDLLREKLKGSSARIKGIVINSPSNPTGTVLRRGDMAEIAEASGGAYIISDEIYHGLVYGEEEHSALEFTDRCFVLNGFSKLYAMTGWRLGYVICPREFVRPMQKIQQNLFICASAFAQHAAVSALRDTSEETREMVEEYDRRRCFILGELKRLGFDLEYEPRGAFYVFANASKYTDDVYRFCLEVLEEAHVALTPGIDFGSAGEGYVRFSYANSIEKISEGMRRLGKYLMER